MSTPYPPENGGAPNWHGEADNRPAPPPNFNYEQLSPYNYEQQAPATPYGQQSAGYSYPTAGYGQTSAGYPQPEEYPYQQSPPPDGQQPTVPWPGEYGQTSPGYPQPQDYSYQQSSPLYGQQPAGYDQTAVTPQPPGYAQPPSSGPPAKSNLTLLLSLLLVVVLLGGGTTIWLVSRNHHSKPIAQTTTTSGQQSPGVPTIPTGPNTSGWPTTFGSTDRPTDTGTGTGAGTGGALFVAMAFAGALGSDPVSKVNSDYMCSGSQLGQSNYTELRSKLYGALPGTPSPVIDGRTVVPMTKLSPPNAGQSNVHLKADSTQVFGWCVESVD